MNGRKVTDSSVKVLLASDGSIAAQVAESWVIHGRWADTPEVEVIAVAGPPIVSEAWLPPSAPVGVREGIIAAHRREEAAAQDIADAAAARIRAAGIPATGTVRSGEPGVEILERVEEVHRRWWPWAALVGPTSARRSWAASPSSWRPTRDGRC